MPISLTSFSFHIFSKKRYFPCILSSFPSIDRRFFHQTKPKPKPKRKPKPKPKNESKKAFSSFLQQSWSIIITTIITIYHHHHYCHHHHLSKIAKIDIFRNISRNCKKTTKSRFSLNRSTFSKKLKKRKNSTFHSFISVVVHFTSINICMYACFYSGGAPFEKSKMLKLSEKMKKDTLSMIASERVSVRVRERTTIAKSASARPPILRS